MLNEVLTSAAAIGIFKKIGTKATRDFLEKIFKIGFKYDCNQGEILEDLAEELKLCYCCLEFDRPLKNGLCDKCK